MNPETLADLAPLLHRVVALDAHAAARLRCLEETATLFARLPFGVLVSRAVPDPHAPASDEAFRAGDLLAWLSGEVEDPPRPDNLLWRGSLAPASGWRRIAQVPDGEIRRVVREGALTLKESAERDGIPKGAPPRQDAAAVLDAVGLSFEEDGLTAEVTVRTVSALTRMGFLARDSHAFIDAGGTWLRVVATYGTVYQQGPDALAFAPR